MRDREKTEARAGEQRKEKPQAGKQRKEKGRGEGKPGRGAAVFCSLQVCAISAISATSRGAQRGNKAQAPGLGAVGAHAPESRRRCSDRCPGAPSPQGDSQVPKTPSSPASILPTPRPATYFSIPAPAPPAARVAAEREPSSRARRRPRPRSWWRRLLALGDHKSSSMPAPDPAVVAAGVEAAAALIASRPRSLPTAETLRPSPRARGWRRGGAGPRRPAGEEPAEPQPFGLTQVEGAVGRRSSEL
jgi:hypothetical protein